MTQRVRDGLGLPAGIYRLHTSGPTAYVPNGITADGVESIVYANVVPVSGDRYDWVNYNAESGVFVPTGNPQPSPTSFNDDAAGFINEVLREIFFTAHPGVDLPYLVAASDSRVNIVDDLATFRADFILHP